MGSLSWEDLPADARAGAVIDLELRRLAYADLLDEYSAMLANAPRPEGPFVSAFADVLRDLRVAWERVREAENEAGAAPEDGTTPE